MSESNGEREKWRESKTKMKEEIYTIETETLYPKTFLNSLCVQTLGQSVRGSAKHIQQGAILTLGLVLASLIWVI